VLAIAGGAHKCAWLRERLHADWTLDYRAFSDADSLGAAVRALAGGVDVYFDNVGGMVTDAVLPQIRRRARIVICGQISQYSGALDTPLPGPRFLHHILYQRATIQGILARDYLHRMDEMLATVGPWVRAGEIVFEETRVQGFEQLPTALQSLFTGDHRGKLIVEA
jgi:NADPH-dependent curcumin reductase CurA